MPSIVLLAPVVLLLASAGVVALCGTAGWKVDRIALGVGSFGAILIIIALWAPVRSAQELSLGQLGFGAPLDLRLDAVGFAFSLAAATLVVIQLDVEDAQAPRPPWGMLLAAWLALSWVGALLQVRGGTAIYAAVPISTLTVPIFTLLAAAALVASGLFPWRGWPSQLWGRPALRAAGMAVATLYPLGFYLIVRAYEVGDGRFPHFALNAVLASIGVLVAFGAAARAHLP